jgi:hypothetical protein
VCISPEGVDARVPGAEFFGYDGLVRAGRKGLLTRGAWGNAAPVARGARAAYNEGMQRRILCPAYRRAVGLAEDFVEGLAAGPQRQ